MPGRIEGLHRLRLLPNVNGGPYDLALIAEFDSDGGGTALSAASPAFGYPADGEKLGDRPGVRGRRNAVEARRTAAKKGERHCKARPAGVCFAEAGRTQEKRKVNSADTEQKSIDGKDL